MHDTYVVMEATFLSTLSLRRATEEVEKLSRVTVISIHALLAESDLPATRPARKLLNFYPRSPCGERHRIRHRREKPRHFYPRSPCGERRPRPQPPKARVLFLSTLSLRRATRLILGFFSLSAYFYPRSPCGERPCMTDGSICFDSISIHALLAESDNQVL